MRAARAGLDAASEGETFATVSTIAFAAGAVADRRGALAHLVERRATARPLWSLRRASNGACDRPFGKVLITASATLRHRAHRDGLGCRRSRARVQIAAGSTADRRRFSRSRLEVKLSPKKHGIARVHADHLSLLDDPELDVICVGLPERPARASGAGCGSRR